jgi:hypothetical protein
MKRLTLLLVMIASVAFGQSDTTQLNTLINANFPDNVSNFITPARLRTVSQELMRSGANLKEVNTFEKWAVFEDAVTGEDSIKSDVGFYVWDGAQYVEIGGGGSNWGRSGGFISPLTFSDKLNVDTARFAGNLYPDGSGVNIGRSDAKFDTVFANVVQSGCACVQTAKLFIPSAEVLQLNTTPKAFGLNVPAGYMCRVLSVDAFIDYGTTAYATNLRMGVSPVGAEFVSPTLGGDFFLSEPDFLAQTANAWGQFQPFPRTSPVSYGDWEAYVRVGDPTAGDSDVTLYLTYMLIEL